MPTVYTSNGSGTIAATPVSPPPAGNFPNAPAWAQAMTPGTWVAMSANTIAAVDASKVPALNPNYPNKAPWDQVESIEGILNLWSGAALLRADTWSTHGGILYWGGGHNGRAGSDVYILDLGNATFSLGSHPYPGPYNWPYADGNYPDGSPVPPHTYSQQGYHPNTKTFWQLRGMQQSTSAPSNDWDISNAHGLRLVSPSTPAGDRDWVTSPINTGLGAGAYNSGGCGCYDGTSDCFWVNPNMVSQVGGSWNLAKLSNTGTQNPDGTWGTWTNHQISHQPPTDSSILHIPGDEILVWNNYRSSSAIYAYEKSGTGLVKARVLLTEGTANAPTREKAPGWEWSESRQAIIYWRRGSGVYEIKKPTNWRTGIWTWNKLTNDTLNGTSAPPALDTDANGVYTKFKVVRYADFEVAVVTTRTDQPAWAFRIPL
jgi:hypothetical protein